MKSLNSAPLSTQKGFTLIELVVVIVILGILAATAAPKFIDLTGDAKGATVQAVRASIESATSMAHAKALIKSQTDATGTIDVNGTADDGDINLVHGWPKAELVAWDELLDVELGADAPFTAVVTDNVIVWYPTITTAHSTATAAIGDKCYVSYTESDSSATKPGIALDIDEC